MTSDTDTPLSEDQSEAVVHDDEPTSEDGLERRQYTKALARLAVTCKTPLVIGIYGTWGVGKTSLMKLIEKELDITKAVAVWFDPWRHQFDENPVVALAHTLVANLKSEKVKEEGKKLVTVISIALGSRFLKAVTGLSAKDVRELGDLYEKERFQVRESRVRLRDHFEMLVQRVKQQEAEPKRLVFFIDDLDRCMPDEVLKLLEGLKLYLNIEGCVYFLGVDRRTLEQSIKFRYKDVEIRGVNYLDKIVQLPFTVPLIEPQLMGSFVDSLLSQELQSCRELLVEGLGDNPRQVKRFINTLTLNHQLAVSQEIPNYDSRVLALVLLFQLTASGLYDRICWQPGLLIKLKQKPEENEQLLGELSPRPERLRNAISRVNLPDEATLKRYIYLTRVAGVAKEETRDVDEVDLGSILMKHEEWLQSKGASGERAALSGANLSGANLSGVNLREANLRKATLSGANLRKAALCGAALSWADLRGAVLREADLSEANLSWANLSGVNLSGVNLSGVNLSGADLSWAALSEANLSEANLSEADLSEANLSGADLSEANLSGVNLSGADLRRADLSGATISQGQLAACKTYEGAILPEDLRPES